MRLSDLRRQFLLGIYAAAGANGADAMSRALSHAQRWGLPVTQLADAGVESPVRLAVRIAHALEIGRVGITLWSGMLEAQPTNAPAQYLALVAARLLAGRDQLVLLAAALRATDGDSPDAGALVDAETCARIAVAGLDLESELASAHCARALRAAGDVLACDAVLGAARSADTPAMPRYLVVGLNVSAAVAAGLPRVHG